MDCGENGIELFAWRNPFYTLLQGNYQLLAHGIFKPLASSESIENN